MKCLRTTTRGSKRNRKGAVLVETALCLPILVTVVLGIIQFGRGMVVTDVVNESAREGARLAIVAGSTNATVTTAVQDFLQNAGVNPEYATVTITVTAYAGNPNPGNQVGSANTRDLCTVAVEVPFSHVAYMTGSWLQGQQLVGSCSMRHQ